MSSKTETHVFCDGLPNYIVRAYVCFGIQAESMEEARSKVLELIDFQAHLRFKVDELSDDAAEIAQTWVDQDIPDLG